MIALAVGRVRYRPSGYIACFVVLFIGAVALLLCGGLVETGVLSGGASATKGSSEALTSAAASKVLIPVGAVFGGLCVLLTVVIVASTLSLTVRQRAHELALLRAIGTTPSAMRRMLSVEVLVIGVPALLLAWFPSLLLGRFLLGVLARGGLVPAGLDFSQGPIPIGCATVATIGSALLASLFASFGLSRVRPVEALADASGERARMSATRILCMLACLGGGIALSTITATVMHGSITSATAGPAALVWAGALALLSPLVSQTIAWFCAPVAWFAAPAFLAVRNTARRPVEAGAGATPVMLVVGLAGAFLLMQRNEAGFDSSSAHTGGTASWINYLLIVLVVGYALASLINTSAATIGDRKGELALLRLIGLTRRAVVAMVAFEALVTAFAGAVLGLILVLVVVVPYNIGLSGEPFFGVDGNIGVVILVTLGAVALTFATLCVVARVVTRKAPQDVLVG